MWYRAIFHSFDGGVSKLVLWGVYEQFFGFWGVETKEVIVTPCAEVGYGVLVRRERVLVTEWQCEDGCVICISEVNSCGIWAQHTALGCAGGKPDCVWKWLVYPHCLWSVGEEVMDPVNRWGWNLKMLQLPDDAGLCWMQSWSQWPVVWHDLWRSPCVKAASEPLLCLWYWVILRKQFLETFHYDGGEGYRLVMIQFRWMGGFWGNGMTVLVRC